MMRPAVALAALAALAGCAESDPRRRAEQAWERCDSITLLNDARLEACTTVIDYEAAPAERRVEALIVRGTIRANLGQYTRAVADFGRALRLGGENPHAYLERGIVHQTRGAYERALRDFDLALAIDPQMSAALERREQALNGSAEAYSNQLNRLTAMLAQAPTDPLLLNNRCWLRVTNDDDLDAALADCNAALLADSGFAAAYDSRGLVRLKRGEYAAALADYEAALAIEPGRGHYLYGRGLARRALGMTGEGEADLAAGEQAEPGVAAAYAGYGVET